MSEKNPSIRDIARAAGVCPMTVSLALRNDRGVSKATQRRIQELARRMGYRRDPVVAHLMARLPKSRRGHGPLLAFITDHDAPFAQLASSRDISSLVGAQRQAEAMGYTVEEFQVTGKMTGPKLSKILRTRGIEGVLIGPLRQADARLDLQWSAFSSVAIGYSLKDPELDRVSNHQFKSIVLAMYRLHALGYRRIGLATTAQHDHRVHHVWKAGFLLAIEHLGIKRPVPKCTVERKDDDLKQWFLKHRPDVVLGDSSLTAWPETEWLRRDCDYASLHIHPSETRISGIQQNWELLGRMAVSMLVSRIHEGTTGIPRYPVVTMGDGEWVDGTTTQREEVG